MADQKEKLIYFLSSLFIIIIIFRTVLYFSPHINLDVKMFNIHHLFIGSFILIIGTILILFGIINKLVLILTGIGSGLVLDEIIYLILTDGSDLAYLSKISFVGMVILVLIIFIFTGGVYYAKDKLEKT